jgi:redox-sensitive bicupin YhaK (pirin superfamily)
MSIQFSPVIATRAVESSGIFSVRHVEIDALGRRASPVALLDNFRVSGRPFGPHPHAGFSAITYVFEDSPGALRSRDSLGNDLVIRPGGIVWLQAGSGALHQEVPADATRALHGAQIYVNLSAKHKSAPPQTLWLQPNDVPEWRHDRGDRVRVVVGSFDGIRSPLVPAEPFNFLDVTLRQEISFNLPPGHNAIAYVLDGEIAVRGDDQEENVHNEQALALHSSTGHVTLAAVRPAHLLVLSGAEIQEPVLVQGPFIMNEPSQIEAALERYRAGGMGRLTAVSEG